MYTYLSNLLPHLRPCPTWWENKQIDELKVTRQHGVKSQINWPDLTITNIARKKKCFHNHSTGPMLNKKFTKSSSCWEISPHYVIFWSNRTNNIYQEIEQKPKPLQYLNQLQEILTLDGVYLHLRYMDSGTCLKCRSHLILISRICGQTNYSHYFLVHYFHVVGRSAHTK